MCHKLCSSISEQMARTKKVFSIAFSSLLCWQFSSNVELMNSMTSVHIKSPWTITRRHSWENAIDETVFRHSNRTLIYQKGRKEKNSHTYVLWKQNNNSKQTNVTLKTRVIFECTHVSFVCKGEWVIQAASTRQHIKCV